MQAEFNETRARVQASGGIAAGGPEPAEEERCGHCGTLATTQKLYLCTGCWQRSYCNQACQLKAWKAGHKKECKLLKPKKSPTASSNPPTSGDGGGGGSTNPTLDPDRGPMNLRDDDIRRSGTTRTLIQMVGRRNGARVCRRWHAIERNLELSVNEQRRLVHAVVLEDSKLVVRTGFRGPQKIPQKFPGNPKNPTKSAPPPLIAVHGILQP